jgi:hypothetical protein
LNIREQAAFPFIKVLEIVWKVGWWIRYVLGVGVVKETDGGKGFIAATTEWTRGARNGSCRCLWIALAAGYLGCKEALGKTSFECVAVGMECVVVLDIEVSKGLVSWPGPEG